MFDFAVQFGQIWPPPSLVPLGATRLRAVHKTQPQEQNAHGKIFGGLLMKKALELAYQNIQLFVAATKSGYSYSTHDSKEESGSGEVVSASTAASSASTASGSSADITSASTPNLKDVRLVWVDDISFLKPVEIGSELCLTSYVSHTQGIWAQV